jgi:Integrase zinc binding domain
MSNCKKVRENKGNRYNTENIENVTLIVQGDKICVPLVLQERTVASYYENLAHPGINRTELTIRQLFTCSRSKHHVEKYCSTCRICQTVKPQRKQYGHLPIKNAQVEPWGRVDVDLIGPWTVKTLTGP